MLRGWHCIARCRCRWVRARYGRYRVNTWAQGASIRAAALISIRSIAWITVGVIWLNNHSISGVRTIAYFKTTEENNNEMFTDEEGSWLQKELEVLLNPLTTWITKVVNVMRSAAVGCWFTTVRCWTDEAKTHRSRSTEVDWLSLGWAG